MAIADADTMLFALLRPAAGGIYTVSSGQAAQLAVQERLYGAQGAAEVDARWRQALGRVGAAQVAVLGVPSDVGAGFVRGANLGPQALRQALLDRGGGALSDPRVVDVGDVLVVPQLLEDEMLSEAQLRRTRQARYGDGDSPLPVSPLTCASEVVRLLRARNPRLLLLTLGGDHSVTWPVLDALVPAGGAADVGVLHFDAHTDLLPERLGIRTCFATWAYHANERLGRGGRLVQVGIRTSGRTKQHWESTLGVRQVWMDEVAALGAQGLSRVIIEHLRQRGVRRLYISNDIDGTGEEWGAATGTPEPGGLSPELVSHVIAEVGAAFAPIGADLMEVAPPLGRDAGEPGRTLALGARYLEDMLGVLLRQG